MWIVMLTSREYEQLDPIKEVEVAKQMFSISSKIWKIIGNLDQEEYEELFEEYEREQIYKEFGKPWEILSPDQIDDFESAWWEYKVKMNSIYFFWTEIHKDFDNICDALSVSIDWWCDFVELLVFCKSNDHLYNGSLDWIVNSFIESDILPSVFWVLTWDETSKNYKAVYDYIFAHQFSESDQATLAKIFIDFFHIKFYFDVVIK